MSIPAPAVRPRMAALRTYTAALISREYAVAATAADVQWPEIGRFYELLETLQHSPLVALNRAVAVGFGRGPAAALAVLDALPTPDLDDYPFFHVARAEALERLGRMREAVACYEAALTITQNATQRRHLQARIASASGPGVP